MEMCRSRDAARSAERSGAREPEEPSAPDAEEAAPKKPGEPAAAAGVAARAGDAKCSATTVSVAPASLPSGRQSLLASQTQIEAADAERASHADATSAPEGCAATHDTSSPCPYSLRASGHSVADARASSAGGRDRTAGVTLPKVSPSRVLSPFACASPPRSAAAGSAAAFAAESPLRFGRFGVSARTKDESGRGGASDETPAAFAAPLRAFTTGVVSSSPRGASASTGRAPSLGRSGVSMITSWRRSPSMTPSRRLRAGDLVGALSGGSRLFVGSGSTPNPCSPANEAKLNDEAESSSPPPPPAPEAPARSAGSAGSAEGVSGTGSGGASGALRALLESPSCGSSAPPEASAALSRAASSALRPARSERGRLRASVPKNVPGASKTRRVFSSAPLTKTTDPPARVAASVFASAFSPPPSLRADAAGGSAATHVTAWPWICGRAISRHPVVGASSVSVTGLCTSRKSLKKVSSTRLSQLACARAVMSTDPESRKRPAASQDKLVTSPAWPADAGAGAQRSSPPAAFEPARRHACSAPPCACASTRRARASNMAP